MENERWKQGGDLCGLIRCGKMDHPAPSGIAIRQANRHGLLPVSLRGSDLFCRDFPRETRSRGETEIFILVEHYE